MIYVKTNDGFILSGCWTLKMDSKNFTKKFKSFCKKSTTCLVCPLDKFKSYTEKNKVLEVTSGKVLHLDQEESIDKQS